MADSIPSLRRKLQEAQTKIAELEARGPVEVERIITREVPVEVVREIVRTVELQPEKETVIKVVEVEVPFETVRYEYIDRVQTEYVTDPALESTIRQLQEELRACQSSQLDL